MPVVIYPRGGEKSFLCTAENFQRLFDVCWLNEIVYASKWIQWRSCLSHVVAARKKWVHAQQKWLGHYFSKEICTDPISKFAISWIDDRLGYGLFTEQALPAFSYIGEYAGVVRMSPLFGALKNLYLFEYFIADGLTAPYVIDARKYGNHVRFVNHSTEPNAKTASAWHHGRSRIIVHTSQSILSGEQITYDYGFDYWRRRAKPIAIKVSH